MEISLANSYDIDDWMSLVYKVSPLFPGLESREALEEHRETVLAFISQQAAICGKIHGKIVGTLLFSRENSMLCFLAVDAAYRRMHIAEKMLSYALTFLKSGTDVYVTTYREGIPEGKTARAFYKRMGFEEGKLTEEFGTPVQEFILKH